MDYYCCKSSWRKNATVAEKQLSQEDSRPRLGVEAIGIAKQNRVIAKARLEAKKQKKKHGIYLPNQPLPSLIEHLSFYGCSGVSTGEVDLPQQLPQAPNSCFHPWLGNLTLPCGPSNSNLRQDAHFSIDAMEDHMRWDRGSGARLPKGGTLAWMLGGEGGLSSRGGRHLPCV